MASPFSGQPFSGIATFGRQPHTRDLDRANVAILGVPYDGSVSYRSGCRFGPRAIREQSLLLWGYNNALQVAPFQSLNVVDYGDVDVIPPDIQATHQIIERDAVTILDAGCQLISLGGEHSISLPLLRAHAAKHGPLAVVQFDAHPDTWDCEYAGQRYSHGTPFRRALEENLIAANRYFQIGIRGPTAGPQDYHEARQLGARLVTTDDLLTRGISKVIDEVHAAIGGAPVYVTIDIDAVDPAYAPGTGTPEVGGISSREMLRLVRQLLGLNIVGADVVEVSPPHDHSGITSILAANLVFELLSLMAKPKKRPV